MWNIIDGKHVVFGQVVEGMTVVRAVEKYGTSEGRPKARVVIADCGQLKEEEKVSDNSILAEGLKATRKSVGGALPSSSTQKTEKVETPKKINTSLSLLVSGLAEKATDKEVAEMLKEYNVAETSVWTLGRSSGLAWVEFDSAETISKVKQDIVDGKLALSCEIHTLENAKDSAKKQGTKRQKEDEEEESEDASEQKKVKLTSEETKAKKSKVLEMLKKKKQQK